MDLNLQYHYPHLDDSEKELIHQFFQKRFAKLFRLTAKKREKIFLVLSCKKEKTNQYLFEAKTQVGGKTFYADSKSKDINNGLTELAKRLRKKLQKEKEDH